MTARHRRRTVPVLALTVPIVLVGGVAGGFAVHSSLTAEAEPEVTLTNARAGVDQAPAPAPTGLPARPDRGAATKGDTARATSSDLGTVKGTYVLKPTTEVPEGSRVVFSLRGPQRLVRVDRSAPYEVAIDTTKLRDGAYQVRIATLVRGGKPELTKATLKIANGTTGPTATKKPTPTVTRTTPAPDPTTPTKKPTPTATTPTDGSPAALVVTLTNAERAKHGCSALKVNATLTKVAQAHSEDMVAKNYFSHTGKDGRDPFQRMRDAGYQFSTAAENIAAGQRTAEQVVQGWMNSAGHRANILNCGLKEIGVGYALGGSYGVYWTQAFGTPR